MPIKGGQRQPNVGGPAWLTQSQRAAAALRRFIDHGRDGPEIIRLVELLRRHVSGQRPLPSRRDIKRARTVLDRVSQRSAQLLRPFKGMPKPAPSARIEAQLRAKRRRLKVPNEETASPSVEMVEWYFAVTSAMLMNLEECVPFGIRN